MTSEPGFNGDRAHQGDQWNLVALSSIVQSLYEYLLVNDSKRPADHFLADLLKMAPLFGDGC